MVTLFLIFFSESFNVHSFHAYNHKNTTNILRLQPAINVIDITLTYIRYHLVLWCIIHAPVDEQLYFIFCGKLLQRRKKQTLASKHKHKRKHKHSHRHIAPAITTNQYTQYFILNIMTVLFLHL